MDKKFELTNESREFMGTIFYRIKALKDFGKVKAGDLGGFVEKESNLSQKGNCWIYDDALVRDDALVCDDAIVYDDAEIYGGVRVRENAEVSGHALVYDYAHIYNNAKVYGNAKICNIAEIFGNARVYGHARVYGSAKVSDNAKVYNSAAVCGKALVCDNAEVNKEMKISSGIFTTNTLEESIRCQTGLIPCNEEVIAYKQVNKDLTSFYDKNFKYVVGQWAEVENPEISDKSCASGLHFSNATYWDTKVPLCDTTFLIAKIRLEDIITVQQGKIRCKRAFIMGTYNIEEGE